MKTIAGFSSRLNAPATALPALKSICILRLSAIGDITHVLPVVHTLREQRPDTAITWVIGKLEHRLLAGLPGVEFIVLDKASGLTGLRQLRRQLRGRRFDALLHMQVALRANLASLCVSAPLRVGYDRPRSKDLHGCFVNHRIDTPIKQHVLETLASFVTPLGLKCGPPQWSFPLDEQDHAFAARNVDPQRPTLVISPVSSHPLRNWAPQHYAAVADHAIQQHGFQVILSGGPSPYEREVGDTIEAAMRHRPDNLIGQDTLKQLTALLATADLVLAPDTGPMHIANAVGTPVIGLHAASNPKRSGPYHSLAWCVDRYDQAARHYKNCSADELKWGTKLEYPGVMDLIAVEAVTAKLDQWARLTQ